MADRWRITKVGAAVEQLEWAIELLIEKLAYIPAITLAAAAEEVLGRAPGVQPSFLELRDSLSSKSGVAAKIVADEHLNRARNWLKHWSSGEKDSIEVELETEAILYITRGLTNLSRTGGPMTPQAERFDQWVRASRPDLLICEISDWKV